MANMGSGFRFSGFPVQGVATRNSASKGLSSMDRTSVDGGGGYSSPGFEPGQAWQGSDRDFKESFMPMGVRSGFSEPSFELGQAGSKSSVGEGYSSDDSFGSLQGELCFDKPSKLRSLDQHELPKDDSESDSEDEISALTDGMKDGLSFGTSRELSNPLTQCMTEQRKIFRPSRKLSKGGKTFKPVDTRREGSETVPVVGEVAESEGPNKRRKGELQNCD